MTHGAHPTSRPTAARRVADTQPGPAPVEDRYVVPVAPDVLATMAERPVEQVPGVVRLAHRPAGRRVLAGALSYARGDIRLAIGGGSAPVIVHVVSERDRSLQGVGSAVQDAVGQAVEQLVGMQVESVDVYVQDVE